MEQLYKMFKNILLTKSHITAKYSIEKESPLLEQDYVDKIIESEINQKFVQEITKYTNKPKRIESWYDIRWEKELFVFEPKDFKLIVEACIQNLSDEQIAEIKRGNTFKTFE